jgi:hypothetical protein
MGGGGFVRGNVGLAPNMLVTTSELQHYHNPNDWYWYNMDHNIPDEGWKIHVSGNLGNAAIIYRKVLPELRQRDLVHKFLPASAVVQQQNGNQLGKILCIYPQDLAEAFHAVGWVDQALQRADIRGAFGRGAAPIPVIPASPVIPHDIHVGVTRCYARYGGFSNDYVWDPNLRQLQPFQPANGSHPAWINDPWPNYPQLPANPQAWPPHPRAARRLGAARRV